MTSTTSYVPGMCNINKAEIAYRKKAMWFGIGLSAVLFIGLLALNASTIVIVAVLFLFVFIGAINFLQVRNKFCVSYAASGRQNADEGSEAASEITEETARAADKAKARKMNTQALGITIVVLAICAAVAMAVQNL